MIIIKVSSGSSVHSKYCLIEAQGNLSVGCWLQEKKVIEPKIPHFIFNQLKTIYNAESFTQSYTWNKSHHFNGVLKKKYKKYLDNPKFRKKFQDILDSEKPFDENSKSMKMFEQCTQLDFETMQPLTSEDKNFIESNEKILNGLR